jgi:copper transport protein
MRTRRLLLALVLASLVPAVARAHGHLQRSSPSAGDALRAAPRLLRLEFSEAPELAMSTVRLLDSLGRDIRLSPVHTAGDSLRVLVAELGEGLVPGRYTVRWRIAGRDGHPVHGQYDFVVLPNAATVGPAVPTPAAPVASPPPRREIPAQTHRDSGFDSESTTYVLIRWAQFLALLLVVGAVAFRWLVLRRAARPPIDDAVRRDGAARARRLASVGAIVLACSAVARLIAQWVALRVDAVAPSAMPLVRVIRESSWGYAWQLEMEMLAVLVVGLLVASRRRGDTVGWAIAALAAIGLSVVPALSGHAAASPLPLSILFDALHVLAAGGWMGGLCMLLAAGLPATRLAPEPERGAAMAAMVNAFSPTALAFAGVVVFTGVNAAWRNIETSDNLFGTSYGRVLLFKLAALGVAALIGLYNWKRARPALALTGDAAAIRRAMRAELAAGVVILLITAVLVALPTPVVPTG